MGRDVIPLIAPMIFSLEKLYRSKKFSFFLVVLVFLIQVIWGNLSISEANSSFPNSDIFFVSITLIFSVFSLIFRLPLLPLVIPLLVISQLLFPFEIISFSVYSLFAWILIIFSEKFSSTLETLENYIFPIFLFIPYCLFEFTIGNISNSKNGPLFTNSLNSLEIVDLSFFILCLVIISASIRQFFRFFYDGNPSRILKALVLNILLLSFGKQLMPSDTFIFSKLEIAFILVSIFYIKSFRKAFFVLSYGVAVVFIDKVFLLGVPVMLIFHPQLRKNIISNNIRNEFLENLFIICTAILMTTLLLAVQKTGYYLIVIFWSLFLGLTVYRRGFSRIFI